MNKRMLLTGATGFVGETVARRFIKEGWQVHLLVSAHSDLSNLDNIRARIGVHIHDGSMPSMRRIFDGARPEIVTHLASRFIADHSVDDVDAMVRSNIGLSAQLAEVASLTGVAGFLNAGTSWQTFEGDERRCVNLYAATKEAFEGLLRWYADARGLRALTLKLYDTYGPGDRRRKLVKILANAARTGEVVDMSPGEQIMDLTHVDDIANAFAIAAERVLSGSSATYESFFLSGTRLTLKELVAKVGAVDGSVLNIRFGGRPYRPREVMMPWTGTGLPGWQPTITLDEGIRQMLCF
jgi:nucleoside-diphosphate-sugar epimerase